MLFYYSICEYIREKSPANVTRVVHSSRFEGYPHNNLISPRKHMLWVLCCENTYNICFIEKISVHFS